MSDDWGFRRGLNTGEEYQFAGTPDRYLARTPVDVAVFQVYPKNGDGPGGGTLTAAVGLAGCAFQGNPDCQVYIYASHTGDVGQRDNPADMRTIYEPLATAIRNAYPGRKPALVIPTPLAYNAMLDAGQGDLWIADGHANDKGRYLTALLFYSILYRRDCTGARTSGFTNGNIGSTMTTAFATAAQRVAWDVASTYAFAGVGGTPIRSVSPALGDSPARVQRQALSVYTLSGRALPAFTIGSAPQQSSTLRISVTGTSGAIAATR
jgi:hypothetical protein